MHNQIHGLSAQMTQMTEELATTMDAWVTQMTEEMGKLAMTLERVTTLENSVAEIKTTTANLDERMAVLPGEIRTTTATRVEYEELKAHAGVTCHNQMLYEHFARHTFAAIFDALHSLQEWAQQAETAIQPLLS